MILNIQVQENNENKLFYEEEINSLRNKLKTLEYKYIQDVDFYKQEIDNLTQNNDENLKIKNNISQKYEKNIKEVRNEKDAEYLEIIERIQIEKVNLNKKFEEKIRENSAVKELNEKLKKKCQEILIDLEKNKRDIKILEERYNNEINEIQIDCNRKIKNLNKQINLYEEEKVKNFFIIIY